MTAETTKEKKTDLMLKRLGTDYLTRHFINVYCIHEEKNDSGKKRVRVRFAEPERPDIMFEIDLHYGNEGDSRKQADIYKTMLKKFIVRLKEFASLKSTEDPAIFYECAGEFEKLLGKRIPDGNEKKAIEKAVKNTKHICRRYGKTVLGHADVRVKPTTDSIDVKFSCRAYGTQTVKISLAKVLACRTPKAAEKAIARKIRKALRKLTEQKIDLLGEGALKDRAELLKAAARIERHFKLKTTVEK